MSVLASCFGDVEKLRGGKKTLCDVIGLVLERLISPEETKQVLRLSLTEFSLPKFYLLFGISKVKSAAVIAFRSSYRDRSFSPGSYERETFALSSLETVTEALLEIMEVGRVGFFMLKS